MKRLVLFLMFSCLTVAAAACTAIPGGSMVDVSDDDVEKAVQIAFDDACVSPADARGLEVSLEDEDGKTLYEVEFTVERVEYTYHIDTVSFKIEGKEMDMENS